MHATDRKAGVRLRVGTEFFFSLSPTELGSIQIFFWGCQEIFPSESSGRSVKITIHSILTGYLNGFFRLPIARIIPTVLVMQRKHAILDVGFASALK